MKAASRGCSQKNAGNSDMKSDELRNLRWSSFSPEEGEEHIRALGREYSISKNIGKLNLNSVKFFRTPSVPFWN
jgi:hypothetical protein